MNTTILNNETSLEWKCYLFGSTPGQPGSFIYTPAKNNIPNFFIRYMMKVCLGCVWVKNKS